MRHRSGALADGRAGATIDGVDLSPAMLDALRAKLAAEPWGGFNRAPLDNDAREMVLELERDPTPSP